MLSLASKALYWCGVAVFVAAMLFTVSWVTVSFNITGNGKIKWGEGFEQTKCHWLNCKD